VTGYGKDDQASIPGRSRGFSLCCHVQTGFRTHPVSFPMSIELRVAETIHSPPSSARI